MSSDSDAESDTKRLPLPLRPLSIMAFCDFRPESRDVVLVCYPKCDTKVIEIILWKLLKPHSQLPPLDSWTGRHIPLVESLGLKNINSSQMWPRLFKTHLPRYTVPIHHRPKYIYVVRNPWDAVVACYRSAYPDTTTDHDRESFDDFFKLFVDNEHGYGNFFDHVKQWTCRSNIERENFIAMTYEDIKSQPRGALFTVAAFLGEPYLGMLLQSDDALVDILKAIDKASSWSHRKRIKRAARPILSDDQTKIIEDKLEQHLKATDIEHQWKNMLKDGKVRTTTTSCRNLAGQEYDIFE